MLQCRLFGIQLQNHSFETHCNWCWVACPMDANHVSSGKTHYCFVLYDILPVAEDPSFNTKRLNSCQKYHLNGESTMYENHADLTLDSDLKAIK